MSRQQQPNINNENRGLILSPQQWRNLIHTSYRWRCQKIGQVLRYNGVVSTQQAQRGWVRTAPRTPPALEETRSLSLARYLYLTSLSFEPSTLVRNGCPWLTKRTFTPSEPSTKATTSPGPWIG